MSKSNWKKHSSDLLEEYEKRGLIQPSQFSLEGWNRGNYTIWSGKAPNGRTLYHCVFTCPVRGIHFPCGRLKNKSSAALEIDAAVWYKTERQALQAAAAKAIDCLNQEENPEHRRCADIPAMLASGPVLPSMPYFLARHLAEKRQAVLLGRMNQYWASAA